METDGTVLVDESHKDLDTPVQNCCLFSEKHWSQGPSRHCAWGLSDILSRILRDQSFEKIFPGPMIMIGKVENYSLASRQIPVDE